MTGLLTRAEFDTALQKVFIAASVAQPASLIMVDIDHFKKVNDNHGHPTGDQVLKEMGRLLGSVILGKGFEYRYGGEEFAVILPNHIADEALSVAERVRRSVEEVSLGELSVTCSCGVAVAPTQASTAETWLKNADQALYDAKDRGRNLIRLYGEAPPEVGQAREPKRKRAEPGTISDKAKEELRLEILRYGGAACPIDETPLEVHDVTNIVESGRSFVVHCPGCGFNSRLPGPS